MPGRGQTGLLGAARLEQTGLTRASAADTGRGNPSGGLLSKTGRGPQTARHSPCCPPQLAR